MAILSQNKKIAISAMAVFVISFTSMLFFLDAGKDLNQTQADVLHSKPDDVGEYQQYAELETPVFVTNAEGKFEYVNDKFCSFVRANCERTGEMKIYDYVSEGGHAELASMYAKLLQGGKKIEGMGPVLISSGKKSEKLILLTGDPILDNKDRVQSIIFTVKDLTKQVEALQ